jgi:hypothetical protein
MDELYEKIEQLKRQFSVTDAFGDAYDDLHNYFMEKIDSVYQTDDKVKVMESIKTLVYDNDLFYSLEEEIEESGIFKMIDEIIELVR